MSILDKCKNCACQYCESKGSCDKGCKACPRGDTRKEPDMFCEPVRLSITGEGQPVLDLAIEDIVRRLYKETDTKTCIHHYTDISKSTTTPYDLCKFLYIIDWYERNHDDIESNYYSIVAREAVRTKLQEIMHIVGKVEVKILVEEAVSQLFRGAYVNN